MLEAKILKDTKKEINIFLNYDDDIDFLINCYLVEPTNIYVVIITTKGRVEKVFYSLCSRDKQFKIYYSTINIDDNYMINDLTSILFNKANGLTTKYKYKY